MPPSSPSTELYTLGRGKLSIAEWTGGSPGAYSDVGNCPEFNVQANVEELYHYSSRGGARAKDKTATLERGYTINFDLDEKSQSNLAMLLMGEVSGNVVHALTNTTKEFAVKFTADNAEGPNDIWEFWKVKLRPRDAMGLISEEWMRLPFVGEGLKDEANHATSPFFDVTGTTTTSTTTTTTA